MNKTLYTIGHSTRSIEDFIELLKKHDIQILIDVRTIPKSRRHPWFNKETLAKTLSSYEIQYMHFPNLGGLRKTHRDSINMGWKNENFRGYADYMQTEAFVSALDELNQLVNTNKSVCVMCAEAVPWRCHRSLIGDAELARDIEVIDIINPSTSRKHSLTSFAVVDKTKNPVKVYYPPLQQSLKL